MEHEQLCILGDYNLDLLKLECSNYSHDFLKCLQSCYMIPTIDKPTRVRKNSATLIDNIFVNNPDQVIASGNIVSDVSDHFSQFCVLKSSHVSPEPSNRKTRDWSHFSHDQFINDLSLVEWSEILRSRGDDVDHVFSTFYSKFNKILNKHAPIMILSKRRIKQLSKPWITKGIRAVIKTKNQLFYNGDNSKYKIYRNMLTNLIRISKKNYYSSYFSENFNNMRKTWEGINNLLNRKRNKRKSINTLKHLNNNIVTTNKSTISNILNEHFTTVGSKLAAKLPSSEKHFTKFLYKEKSPSSSFLFQPITPNELKLEIMSMPANKSHGFYSCPTFILKYACDSIKAILTDIFHLSMETGNYPSKLKMAKVIPIFKADDELDPNNYRPISLLSCFNRIFEKLMQKRMKLFIGKEGILCSSQYAWFRQKHSTEYAILDIVNKIQSNMDKGHFSCGVFIDLKKAFNTVNHDILLKKLDYYGFRGIVNEWFSSYLKQRTQTSIIASFSSDSLSITCGVPQGSLLGPLLFLLYVNDICSCSSKLKFCLFADDTNLLFSHKNLESTWDNYERGTYTSLSLANLK